uniref:Retrotransposon protein, putative, unclassified n=1 Tax=Oryza sativa subsp. japonica TaxID=39947 RepID=Q2QS52_ORYSJ|nr:retrotransposon protein, putative, unclassified [Oryza sativa Japonica Group]
MSWHRAGVLLLGAQSCLPVPGVPAVGGVGKKRLLRQRTRLTVDRVHGSGSQKRTAEIDLSKTDGQDLMVYDRSTADGVDDVSGDVITGDGSDGASSPANNGTATRTEDTYGLRATRRTH